MNKWLEATDEERFDLQSGLRNSILGHHKSYKIQGHHHQNLFTPGVLELYLKEAGFSKVEAEVCGPLMALRMEHIRDGGRDAPDICDELTDVFGCAVKDAL